MKRRLRTIAAIAMAGILAGCIHDQEAADAPATAVAVASYNVGGSITGLTASGLTLAVGSNSVSVAAGASTFVLPSKIAAGSSIEIMVKTQPQAQSCRVTNGTLTMGSADISNIQVLCTTNQYSVGGVITGLSASGLILANGADTLTPTLGTSAFVMPTHIAAGGAYAVSVQTQPTGVICQVINGSGSIVATAVTNIVVACGTWTWQGGSNRVGASGSFGTQGTASAGNIPSARSGAAYWVDAGGNVWLFGGTSGSTQLNDLWRYGSGSGQWTWIGGSQSGNASGIYGSMGVAAAGNVPGARTQATTWTDAVGTLWLFGGTGNDSAGTSGSLNDLWKYVPAQNQWTWAGGANTVWTASDTPPTAVPSARAGAVGWADGSGHLWLFGGNGPQGVTNDLWQLTISGTSWALVSGTQTANQNGIYGTAGTAAGTNVPGSRSQGIGVIDAAGNLWLFGGNGYGIAGGAGLLNDLWKFSPSTAQWTWVSGFRTVNTAGVYGTRSLTDVMSPGARTGAAASTDASGNLWLFGGDGYDVNAKQGSLNDLWKYDATAAQWIWMSGSQTIVAGGTYNTLGTATAGSTPGARSAASLWTDASGSLWLFGGQGLDSVKTSGALNDLWQFAP